VWSGFGRIRQAAPRRSGKTRDPSSSSRERSARFQARSFRPSSARNRWRSRSSMTLLRVRPLRRSTPGSSSGCSLDFLGVPARAAGRVRLPLPRAGARPSGGR
jgi:hypothetical protein